MRCFSLLLVALSFAAEAGFPWVYETTASMLNVRAGPSTNYEVVATLPKGARVIAEGEMAGWLRIRPPEDTPAYIYATYLSCAAALPSRKEDAKSVSGRVTGDSVRLRAKPSLSSTVLATLAEGTPLVGLWREGEWCAVVPPEGVCVWVSAKYARRWGSPAEHEAALREEEARRRAEAEAQRRREEEAQRQQRLVELAGKLAAAAEQKLLELEKRYGAERTRTFPDVPLDEILRPYAQLAADYPGTVAGERAAEIAAEIRGRLPAWRAYVQVEEQYRIALADGTLRRRARELAAAFRQVERAYPGTTYGELAARRAEELEMMTEGGNRGYVVGRPEE